MAYQEHLKKGLRKEIERDPVYWGMVAEIGEKRLKAEKDEHAFWQQAFRKDKHPRDLTYFAIVGAAQLQMSGVAVGRHKGKEAWLRTFVPTARGCFADRREDDNLAHIEAALEVASGVHKQEFGRPFDFTVDVDTKPPGDGHVWISEIAGTRSFASEEGMVAQEVIGYDITCVLEIGYVEAATLAWVIHSHSSTGIARYPYSVPKLMLAAPATKVEILDEWALPPDVGDLSLAARSTLTAGAGA